MTLSRFLAATLSTCLVLAIGEYFAGRWITKHGNALDITRKVLRVDAQLWWRQRANLNSIFVGIPLRTNELGLRDRPLAQLLLSREKILVLGPSSTFGWGVREAETYPAQLEAMLNQKSDAVVINGGEIGYSSAQGMKFFADPVFTEIAPKVVIIGYGVNDLDRHRFYFQSQRSDWEESRHEKSKRAARIFSFALPYDLTAVLFRFAGWVRSIVSRADSCPACAIPPVRVPLLDFEKNMLSLVRRAQARGARTILLTTAVHLPQGGSHAAYSHAKTGFQSALKLWQEGRVSEADAALRRIVKRLPHSDSYQLMARIAANAGRINEAQAFRETANAAEPLRIFQEGIRYNQKVRELARQTGSEIGDIDKWLPLRERHNLFVDPVHFSAEGNFLIAEGLSRLIMERKLLTKGKTKK